MIHSSAKIGKNCKIGPFVSIAANVSIGDHCVIGPHTSIEEEVQIQDHCEIGSFCHIYSKTKIDSGSKVANHCKVGVDGFGYSQDAQGKSHFTPQLGIVHLEKNSAIFDHCSLDRAAFEKTQIGENCTLGGHSHIAHNFSVGENSQIGNGFVVAGSTHFGKGVKLGYRTNCNGHIRIGDNFQCSSFSLINNSTDVQGLQGGHPLAPYAEYLSIKEAIRSLPQYHLWIQKKIEEET